ncbi:MAG: hypothetical protein WBD63_05870 [Phycisphaerae bacterium]|nr:hypothetical protein [Phycisphaerae bacterium]
MNALRKIASRCFALLVLGWMLVPQAQPAETLKSPKALQEIVLAALQAEMPEAQISPDPIAATPDTSSSVFWVSKGGSRMRVVCYRPSLDDLNGDGKPELVMGLQFLDTESGQPKNDFLAVYRIEGAHCERLFRQILACDADRGEFSALEIKDVTGDTKPEICFRYNRVNAGMHRWQWRETFYVISGQPPFNVLLEFIARDGEGSNKAEGHERYAVFHFEDTDGDGINELLVDIYQTQPGGDGVSEKVSEAPQIYRLKEGRYQKAQE